MDKNNKLGRTRLPSLVHSVCPFRSEVRRWSMVPQELEDSLGVEVTCLVRPATPRWGETCATDETCVWSLSTLVCRTDVRV